MCVFLLILLSGAIHSEEQFNEIEWAEKFIERGSYNEAVDLLSAFLTKHKNNEISMKEGFSKVYFLLSKAYYYLADYAAMDNALKKLFTLNTNYTIPATVEKDFYNRVNKVKKQMSSNLLSPPQDLKSKININVILRNIKESGLLIIEDKNHLTENKTISFDNPKSINFNVNKPGTYNLVFLIGNRIARLEKTIQRDMDIELSLTFEESRKPQERSPQKIDRPPKTSVNVEKSYKFSLKGGWMNAHLGGGLAFHLNKMSAEFLIGYDEDWIDTILMEGNLLYHFLNKNMDIYVGAGVIFYSGTARDYFDDIIKDSSIGFSGFIGLNYFPIPNFEIIGLGARIGYQYVPQLRFSFGDPFDIDFDIKFGKELTSVRGDLFIIFRF